jgi:4'-phosphopantetheinyl transferase
MISRLNRPSRFGFSMTDLPETATTGDSFATSPKLHIWPLPGSDDSPASILVENEIVVWRVELDDIEPEPMDPPMDEWFGRILADDELARARRLIRPRDRLRFARCRAALREILGNLHRVPPASLRFGSGSHGKPYLDPSSTNGVAALEFNVSHSGGVALIAVSRGPALGIDVEQIRPIRESDRIVASFFTEVEQAEFREIPEMKRESAFLRGWTRKEAILKGLGKGLAGGPSRYETMFGTTTLTGQFSPVSPRPIVEGWMLWEAAIGDQYVATLAASVHSNQSEASDSNVRLIAPQRGRGVN